MSSNSRTEKLFLTLFFIIVTLLLVGSFESRLANSNGDDHPVVWARYFSNPQVWAGDGNFTAAQYFGRASLSNLLAIITVKWNENFPIWLSWIYVLVQNVALGLAFYLFSSLWAKGKGMALAIALLAYAFTPWQQNLAYYPSMIHSPYPGHLVMPFIVFSAYFLLERQFLMMSLCLAIGGFIHPSQVLQFIMLAEIFLFLRDRTRGFMSIQAYFIIPATTSLLIPLFLIPQSINPLTDMDLIASALSNPHLVPWKSTTFWPFGLPSLIGILALSFLACRDLSETFPYLNYFWWANLLSLVILGAIHFLGVKLRLLPIILLCPFRVSVINSVLLSPLGFIYLVRKSCEENRWLSWISLSLMFLMLFSQSGIFWGPLLALFIWDFVKDRQIGRRWSQWVFVFWWVAFFLCGRPLRSILGSDVAGALRFFMAPGVHLVISQIITSFVLSLLVSRLLLNKRNKKEIVGYGSVVLGIIFTLVQSYHIGQESLTGEQKDRLLVETWAKTETPQDSLFILESGSWRGVSNRRAQVVGYRENRILPYFRYREAKDVEDRLGLIYRSFHSKDYNQLTDLEVEVLGKAFGGTHFVDKVSNSKRRFPIAYEDMSFRVYLLKTDN